MMRTKAVRPQLTDVEAEIRAGGYVLTFSRTHGALLDRDDLPVTNLQLRPAPESAPVELFGHHEELRSIRAALSAQPRVAISGPPGCGKTALLRALQFEGKSLFAAGARYINALNVHGYDVAQLVFQHLFEPLAPPVVLLPIKAPAQIKSVRALLLVDDLEDDVDLDAVFAPFESALVVVAYRQPTPDTISLPNLAHDDAVRLFERELRGTGNVAPEERHILQEMARHFDGNPRRLVALAAEVRERGNVSLERLTSEPQLLAELSSITKKAPRETITADELANDIATAAFQGRSGEVVRLGPGVADALARAGHWIAWERTLNLIRTAAANEDDLRCRAWTCHQSGVRLACLDDKESARAELLSAYALRAQASDVAGAEVTAYDLKLIDPKWSAPHTAAPIPPTLPIQPRPPGPSKRHLRVILLASAGLLAIASAVTAFFWLTAPRASLAMLDYGNGLNLCYHAANVANVIIERPLRKDLGGQLSDCLPWPRPVHGGPVVFDVRVTGKFGRTTTVTKTRIFPAPPSAPPPAPVAVVRKYYEDWNDRRFSEMWQLLSPAFQLKNPYPQWKPKHEYDKSITVEARDSGDRQVAATVVAGDRNGDSHTYHVTWTLVSSNGSWLLDSVSYK